MPSKTDIANNAIRMVGGQPITSFTQGVPNSNVISEMYDPLRIELLAYPWGFAKTYVKLNRYSTVPAFGFDYAYLLPFDWVYTVSVHESDAGTQPILYKQAQIDSQNAIFTDSEDVYLVYTHNEEDPNLWSPQFRRAMTSALARDLSLPIADSGTLHDRFTKQAKRDLLTAKSANGLNSFPNFRPRGSWANSRNGWRNGPNSIWR